MLPRLCFHDIHPIHVMTMGSQLPIADLHTTYGIITI